MPFPAINTKPFKDDCIDALNGLITMYDKLKTAKVDQSKVDAFHEEYKTKPKVLPFQMCPEVKEAASGIYEDVTKIWTLIKRIQLFIISQYPISSDGHNLGVAVLDEITRITNQVLADVVSYFNTVASWASDFKSNSNDLIQIVSKYNKVPSDLISIQDVFKQYFDKSKYIHDQLVYAMNEIYLGLASACFQVVNFMHVNEKMILIPRKPVDELCG